MMTMNFFFSIFFIRYACVTYFADCVYPTMERYARKTKSTRTTEWIRIDRNIMTLHTYNTNYFCIDFA